MKVRKRERERIFLVRHSVRETLTCGIWCSSILVLSSFQGYFKHQEESRREKALSEPEEREREISRKG